MSRAPKLHGEKRKGISVKAAPPPAQAAIPHASSAQSHAPGQRATEGAGSEAGAGQEGRDLGAMARGWGLCWVKPLPIPSQERPLRSEINSIYY